MVIGKQAPGYSITSRRNIENSNMQDSMVEGNHRSEVCSPALMSTNLRQLQRVLGNRAVNQIIANSRLSSSSLPKESLNLSTVQPTTGGYLNSEEYSTIQRLIIDFPPDLGVPSINTDDDSAEQQIAELGDNSKALNVIRARLEKEGIENLNAGESRAYKQVTSMFSSLNTRRVFGPSDGTLKKILSYLNSKDLVPASEVNRRFREEVINEARQRIPYPDFTIFAMLNQVLFPKEFAKGNFTDAAMTKGENLKYAWNQYKETEEGQENLALVLRIFETDTFKKAQPEQAHTYEKQQVIFRPATAGKWSPQIDDSWILSHIHKGSIILLMCDVTNKDTFLDRKANRVTATGREVLLALRNGYKLSENSKSYGKISGGLLLVPPDNLAKTTGILPADLSPIDINELFGTFPLKGVIGDPLKIDNKPFNEQVESALGEAINEQTRAAVKNFDKLRQLFSEKAKLQDKDLAKKAESYEKQYRTCINMLTPDSHVIPYDRQGEYRKSMRKLLVDDSYINGLGKQTSKNVKEAFKQDILNIFEEAERIANGVN